MSQSETIRNGFVTALASLDAANAGPLTGGLSPYPQADSNPPSLYVDGGEVSFDFAMNRGADILNFNLVALVPMAGPDASTQQLLDSLRDRTGSLSIKALVEADKTLGGACKTLRVTRMTRPQVYETPGQPARIGCEWAVEVYA